MSSVEVKCLETFAYYPAILKDYDAQKQQLWIAYEDDWKAPAWVSLDLVRPAPSMESQDAFKPKVGETLEAMAKSSENEPYSWWPATVKNVRGDFYFISFTSFDDSHNEIMEKDMLRPINSAPCFKPSDFKRAEIPLPKELVGQSSDADFKSLCENAGLLSMSIDNNKKVIVMLGSQAAVKRAQLLSTMHIRHLVELSKLKARTAQRENAIQELQQRLRDGKVVEFKVPVDLVGLVIGKKGKNVRDAEAIQGVQNIRVDSATGTITILAKTEEIGNKARALLEFIEERFPIPKGQLGRIVGKGYTNIREIEKNSRVTRIRVADDVPSVAAANLRNLSWSDDFEDDFVDLVIVGNRETVADAKLLLTQHIEFLKQANELNETERVMAEKLRHLTMEVGPVKKGEEKSNGEEKKTNNNNRRNRRNNNKKDENKDASASTSAAAPAAAASAPSTSAPATNGNADGEAKKTRRPRRDRKEAAATAATAN